ncbi:substrate-binding domain-containing protein [Peribacillus sp. NJ11]|uniref:substrate-binding domain-containing protein n=1 Tax=Peribacillus sp. NJ11 TaxID=3055861 RepID=UPI0025A14DD9|nr:substrate-binding domain-containing protein [Peribacillus sp. NJ11]MDM5224587.1 substrate-binding domain-containing protein [Peribacillus sp. NJ11]
MKYLKMSGVMGMSLLLAFAGACSNGNEGAKGGKAETVTAVDSSEKIDYGLFCNDDCKEALTLKASRDSIEGKVGVIVSGTFPYGAGTKRMSEEAVQKYFPKLDLIVGNGNSDPATQTSVVDDFISKNVDIIVIDLVEKDAVNPALERAKKAGIPVITIDRWTPVKVTSLIKAEDVAVGRTAGEKVVELLNGKGNVIELKGTAASTTSIDRNKGIEEAFTGHSDIKIVESTNGDFDQDKSLKITEDLLQRFPKGEIDAIVSHADVMTMGAIQAIRAAGREDEIVVVSVDAQQTALEAVKSGAIDATVAYPIVMPMGIIAAAKTLAGEPIPESIKLDSPLITKENVDTYDGKTGY